MADTIHPLGPFASGQGILESQISSAAPYTAFELAQGDAHDWASRTPERAGRRARQAPRGDRPDRGDCNRDGHMNRKAARALAVSHARRPQSIRPGLQDHEPNTLTPHNLVATVRSKSLGFVPDARESFTAPAEIWVSIYVRRGGSSSGAVVEDLLDDLVRTAMRALIEAFSSEDENAQFQIVPGMGGYSDDGKHYRAERFAVQFTDDEE